MIDCTAIEKPQDLLGSVVIPKRGRDEGKPCVLIGWLPGDGGYALIADGRRRPADRPKKKNMKHLIYTQYRSEALWERSLAGERATDLMVREALGAYGKLCYHSREKKQDCTT